MCNRDCGIRKRAPIHPAQLMNRRINCQQCIQNGTNDGGISVSQCYCCGVCSEDFIRGSLLEFYDKHPDYPVVLIENVDCPGIVNSKAFDDAKIELQKEKEKDFFKPVKYGDAKPTYYIKSDENKKSDKNIIKVFHMFDLSSHFTQVCKGQCHLRRKNEPKYDFKCIQSDLRAAKAVLDGSAKKSKQYKTVEGIETPVYAYICDRSQLIELASPINIDGHCVAVMITGQISQSKKDENEHEQVVWAPEDWNLIMGKKDLSSSSENNLEKLIADITKCVDEFAKHMQERVDLRKSDFLYRYLTKLYRILSEQTAPDQDISQKIKAVYKEIDKDFDYEKLVVFYTDTAQESKYSSLCFPEGKTDTIAFSPDQLIKAVYTDDGGSELRKLFALPDDKAEKAGIYIQHSQASADAQQPPDCFILTYVQWNQKEDDSIKNFFDSLNARLFSLLMTKLAIEKQDEADEQKRNQDILIETFSHDLNQKLEIVATHTKVLSWKIGNRTYVSNDRTVNDIMDYVKDIETLEMQMREFIKEVRENNGGLPENIEPRVFLPYNAFLFNLQEYYNSKDFVRRLYIPTPSTVTMNSWMYPAMQADQVLIERCVNNLLNNAFKYSYRYTNVYLDCYKKDAQYIIEVINYSSPIRDDVKGKMFELGVTQSNVRHYKRKKGKGYGLAIVQHICELHKGNVQCIKNEIISDYNIPVLYRLMDTLRSAKDKNALKFEKERLNIDDEQYDKLMAEYQRLEEEPVDSGVNRVAHLWRKRNVLWEVCNASTDYQEKLTAPYLRMSLRTKTARIIFRITLPQ